VARILYFADIRFPLERANGIQTMETCHALGKRGHRVELIVRPDTHVPSRDPFAYYGLEVLVPGSGFRVPGSESRDSGSGFRVPGSEDPGSESRDPGSGFRVPGSESPVPGSGFRVPGSGSRVPEPPVPATAGTLTIERAPVSGPAAARRLGYLAFALGRAAGSGRADVVMTRDLGVASLLLRLPRSLRPPLVYESHGYAPEVAAALPDLLSTAAPAGPGKLARLARRESRVWKGAEGYVTITEGLAREMTDRYGSRPRLAVVPDGVRSVPGSGLRVPGSGVPGSRFTVGYAGHLYAWKGVDILIEALALVPEAQGLIIGGHPGEPDLSRVQQLAARLGIADRVTFAGFVEPPRVAALLQTADVLALPNPASAISTRATSPLKLFEYMAAGRPIVASDLPAIREVLRDRVDALLVTPGDPRAMADAIHQLSQDSSLGSRLALAALEAASRYSWDRRAERLEALVAAVVQPATAARR
jgi:glycosyltransferase involved in cell wall biosynthesis